MEKEIHMIRMYVYTERERGYGNKDPSEKYYKKVVHQHCRKDSWSITTQSTMISYSLIDEVFLFYSVGYDLVVCGWWMVLSV